MAMAGTVLQPRARLKAGACCSVLEATRKVWCFRVGAVVKNGVRLRFWTNVSFYSDLMEQCNW